MHTNEWYGYGERSYVPESPAQFALRQILIKKKNMRSLVIDAHSNCANANGLNVSVKAQMKVREAMILLSEAIRIINEDL